MIRIAITLTFLAVVQGAWAEDQFEPDNTPEEANEITAPVIRAGHSMHSLDDIDWFTFTIEDNRVLRVVAREDFSLMEMALYDSELNPIINSTVLTADLTPGTYFFSIEPGEIFKGIDFSYVIYMTLSEYSIDTAEPNDNSESATPLTEGVFKQLQSIAPSGDLDWFTFDVPSEKQPVAYDYVVETQPPLRFLWVNVFDEFGSPATLNTLRPESNRALVSLSPGTHTVRVEETSGDKIVPAYNIVVWPTMDPDPYEPDNTLEDATLLMVDGPRQTHNFTDADDEDWYLLLAANRENMAVEADLDVELTLFDSDGETVVFPTSNDGYISGVLPSGGTYYVRARSLMQSPTPEDSVYTIRATLNTEGLNVVGTLTGFVEVGRKALPIDGVEVALTGGLRARTFTDSDGIYVFPMLTQGNYSITTSADGYVSDERALSLGGGVTTANFALDPLVPLEDEDLDGDGNINAVDIQLIINDVLGLGTLGLLGDVNGDGSVNSSDIQTIINRVLGA